MATEHDNRPIWALPQPADRKPRYTREQIAGAALRIADQEGFDAVTMKRIAAELGAATMTLYYYVRNKNRHRRAHAGRDPRRVAVPDAACPAAGGMPSPPSPGGPGTVLIAHPWSLASLNEAQFGPNAMRHLEQSLAAVAGTGLAPPARLELIAAIDDYVSGNALHAVESLARARIAEEDPAMVAAAVAYGIALAPDRGLPSAKRHRTRRAPRATNPPGRR